MNRLEPHIPAVLCFAGLDPTGGAGLQADIETIVSMGGHPLPIATSLTAQDTHDVRALMPIDPRHVIAQARTVLADIPVAAVKIGLLGSVGIVDRASGDPDRLRQGFPSFSIRSIEPAEAPRSPATS